MPKKNEGVWNKKRRVGRAIDRRANGGSYVMEEQVGFLLRLANQRHTRLFTLKMSDGLTTTQFAALTKLHDKEKCTQNYLGHLIAVDAVTIKGVVGRLMSKGLVQIVIDPVDRRRRSISLSPKGKDVIRRAIPIGAMITKETLRSLSLRDQREFLRFLKVIAGQTKL